ncbi:MAG: hypothetical protein RR374_04990 [Clostridia bacterium]
MENKNLDNKITKTSTDEKSTENKPKKKATFKNAKAFEANRQAKDEYFAFYDDIKNNTRGTEDW